MNKLSRLIEFVIFTEPIWAFAAIIFVYLSLLFGVNYYTWLALIIAFLPLLLNYIKQRRISQPTPFDIPILVFMIAVLVGVMVSEEPVLSLQALQSVVVMILLYYAVVNYPYPRATQVWIIMSLILLPVGIAWLMLQWQPFLSLLRSYTFADLPITPPHHQMAIWGFFISASILLGLLVRNRGLLSRIVSGITGLGLLAAIVYYGRQSLLRLVNGVSIEGRIPVWQATLEMIKEHPVTGVGFGCWPLIYHSGAVTSTSITNPHSAYLELYAHTGILGLAAAILAAIVVVRLGMSILRSSYKPFWSGLGLGLLLAIVGMSLLGLIEDAPFGISIAGSTSYHYVISPLPWLMASGLVITHRQLIEKSSPPAMQQRSQ